MTVPDENLTLKDIAKAVFGKQRRIDIDKDGGFNIKKTIRKETKKFDELAPILQRVIEFEAAVKASYRKKHKEFMRVVMKDRKAMRDRLRTAQLREDMLQDANARLKAEIIRLKGGEYTKIGLEMDVFIVNKQEPVKTIKMGAGGGGLE